MRNTIYTGYSSSFQHVKEDCDCKVLISCYNSHKIVLDDCQLIRVWMVHNRDALVIDISMCY